MEMDSSRDATSGAGAADEPGGPGRGVAPSPVGVPSEGSSTVVPKRAEAAAFAPGREEREELLDWGAECGTGAILGVGISFLGSLAATDAFALALPLALALASGGEGASDEDAGEPSTEPASGLLNGDETCCGDFFGPKDEPSPA